MSLDVYLYSTAEHACSKCGHIDRVGSGGCVFDANITHNLGGMANHAGLYPACWRPDEMLAPDLAAQIDALERDKQWNDARGLRDQLPTPHARDLIEPLRAGLALLKSDPERFRRYNPSNGWGNYDGFVEWVERYLAACEANPDAEVRVSR